MVNNSLHMVLLPFSNDVATYPWCDPAFNVIGTKPLDRSLLPKSMAQLILPLGSEVALLFSDGSVVAFPNSAAA